MFKVAVVILNWNGEKYLEEFLPSVIRYSKDPSVEVFVADNGSTDDSLAILGEKFPEVKQILLDKNYGFAEGYNRALDQIEAEYFLILNSDIEVSENWIQPLVSTLDYNTLITGVSATI